MPHNGSFHTSSAVSPQASSSESSGSIVLPHSCGTIASDRAVASSGTMASGSTVASGTAMPLHSHSAMASASSGPVAANDRERQHDRL